MKASIEFTKIQEFSAKTGIPQKKLYEIFRILSEANDGILMNDLIRKTALSKQAITLFEKDFTQFFNPNKNGMVSLNLKGKDMYAKLKTHNYVGDLNLQPPELNLINQLLDERPGMQRQFDQFYDDFETAIKRVELLSKNFDLQNKKILFIGDDDYGSVVSGLTFLADEIFVLEIDTHLADSIREISQKYKLNINVEKYDAYKKLDPKFYNYFDVVFIDPPYTENGVSLFLSRAVDALRQNNAGAKIYLNFGASDLSKERYTAIQQIITKSGLRISELYPDFSRYTGAEAIGSSSSLYVLEKTPQTKALISGNFSGKIYTNE